MPYARQFLQRRHKHLGEQRNGQQQPREHQIDNQAEYIQIIKSVQLKGYVGVEYDAAENNVDIDKHTGHQQENQDRICPQCALAVP